MIGTCEIVPDIVISVPEVVGDIYRMAYDRRIATRKMHQTTVRFGADLWQALEKECAQLGVSVAQYLREAALTRLVYAAGRRGDVEFEAALEVVAGTRALPTPEEPVVAQARELRNVQERSRAEFAESAALAAQGRLARERARMLRARSERHRLR